MTELEAKIQLSREEVSRLRKRLKELNARHDKLRLEKHYYFDFPDERLWKEDKVLRLKEFLGKKLLTFKGPLLKGTFKKRAEYQLFIEDKHALVKLFEGIGLKKLFFFSKLRQKFFLPSVTEITLDKIIGLGYFMEVEAKTPLAIKKVLRRLGIDFKRSTKKSYSQLIRELREKTRIK